MENIFSTHPGISYYYYWILFSCAACFTIHHFISPKLFGRYCDSYAKLKKSKRMEWDSRIVSSIHALVVSLLSLYSLLTEPEMWTNRIEHLSRNGCTALSISVGYFICDMISMPMYWRGRSLIIFLIHHSFSAAAFFYSINIQMTSFYCVIRLISELSTPFTNQRWLFLTAGLTHGHKRVAYSTLVFAVIFSLVRNWIILPYWVLVYCDLGSSQYMNTRTQHPWFDLVWLGCAALLDCLNLYWGRGVYRSGHKALHTVRSARHARRLSQSCNLSSQPSPLQSTNIPEAAQLQPEVPIAEDVELEDSYSSCSSSSSLASLVVEDKKQI